MKNLLASVFVVLSVLSFTSLVLKAQNIPVWVRDMNALTDTATLEPVRTLSDGSGNYVYVLSSYEKISGPNTRYKVYLNKYNFSGTLSWSLVFDNGGVGDPRGTDMAVDNGGNVYIGGVFTSDSAKPMLMKVSAGGIVDWVRNSTTPTKSGMINQVIFSNNLLYISSWSGVAVFDLNGNENWSYSMGVYRIAVDHAGRLIVSTGGSGTNIYRFDVFGAVDFSTQAIDASRIAVDSDNHIYLFYATSIYPYELAKYDSGGVFQWVTNSLPNAPPFGDFAYDLIVDNNNDVLVAGIHDTIYKFNPSGSLAWKKPMKGLDSYSFSAKITYNNLLLIAGTVWDTTDYKMQVSYFNMNGDEVWQGNYNGNTGLQEFTVDMTTTGGDVYVVENNDRNTTLVKFGSPMFSNNVDFSLICVDSAWYDTLMPNYVFTRVFNGSANFINYPSVQAVSSIGDTIINPKNSFDFFGHAANSYQTYRDTITVTGITDFRAYTFLFTARLFGDTTGVIGWCKPVGIKEIDDYRLVIYPNPARDYFSVQNHGIMIESVDIFNILGERVYSDYTVSRFNRDTPYIVPHHFSAGVYFVHIKCGERVYTGKVMVEK